MELKQPGSLASTTKRLTVLRDGYKDQHSLLAQLLAPLGVMGAVPVELSQALGTKIPLTQTLMGYETNVFRDWVWGDGENRATLQLYTDTLTKGRVFANAAFLGSGSGRLPFDLHQALAIENSVLVDINPFLMLVAQEMTMGRSLDLIEFPLAPRDGATVAVRRQLSNSVKGPTAGIKYLFADAMNPPFATGSLDLVVTHWLIDVVPQDFKTLIARINRCLKKDGIWLNCGSLAFNHGGLSRRYLIEEIDEIATSSGGFEVDKVNRSKIPYLQSPASSHSRVEEMTCIAARKIRDVDQPKEFKYLPDWLSNAQLPVPLTTSGRGQAYQATVAAELFGLVDGKRTLSQIAALFAKAYGLSLEDALPSVRGFLTRQFEMGIFDAKF